MLSNKHIAIGLALVALISAAHLSVGASEANVSVDNFLDLRLSKNVSIQARLLPPLRNQNYDQFLLSIDGEDLTKNSFEQIKSKLGGPAGSHVKLEVGLPNGDTETFDVERSFRQDPSARGIQDPMQELKRRLLELKGPNSSANLTEKSSYNADLVARANCIQAASGSTESNKPALGTLMNCVLLSLSIGDFDSADKYLSHAIELMKLEQVDTNTIYRERAVVEDLVLLGKNADAEFVCKYLLRPPTTSRAPRLPQPISVLGSYSLIPSKSAQDASKVLAENISSGVVAQATSFDEDTFWLAQYLESLGLNDKALNLYTKVVASNQSKDYPPSYRGIQPIAFGLYSRARLEGLAGKRDLAEKDLEAIKTSFKLLSSKQQQLINRIPEFFPKLSDVEIAEKSLRDTTSITKPPQAVSYSNQDEFVLSGSLPSFRHSFQLAKKCFELIRANKKTEAESVAKELIVAYRESYQPKWFYSLRQNLFSTNLRLVRGFADRGWYDQANKHLSQLEVAAKNKIPEIPSNDPAWLMLNAERIYNLASTSGKFPRELAVQRLGSGPLRSSRNALSTADRLNVIAEAYFLADEPKRAKLFVDQALLELDTNNRGPNPDSSDKQAAIYMNAACIYAKLSDFKNADNYATLAFNHASLLESELAGEVSDLASVFSNSGRSEQAISVLEKASKLPTAKGYQVYRPDYGTKLAELYAKNGHQDKAIESIGKSLELKKIPAGSEFALAGQLNEKSKNYASAAKYYFEAGKWSGNHLNDEQRQAMLRKSIECAGQAKDYDPSTLAKTYRELSNLVIRTNMEDALVLLQKSAALMPDSDPEKPTQLSSISYLKGELTRIAATKGKTGKPATVNANTQFDDRIAISKQAAELATKNNNKDAAALWLSLASLEAEAKKVDAAVADARKGIAAYQVAHAKRHLLHELLNTGLPSQIAKAGAPEKAEEIMREAQARVDTIAGAGGLPSQAQMSHHFLYLFMQKDYEKADAILDQLLKTDLTLGSYSPPNHDVFVCRMGGGPYPVESSEQVISQIESSLSNVTGADNQHQLHYLNKILAAQTKQFGKDDYRVGLTFAKIAHVHILANQYEDAYKALAAAIEVMHQYEDMLYIFSNLHPDLYKVFQKLNKQDELDKLEAVKVAEQKERQARHYRSWAPKKKP
ncbi:MAG: hypothetical protein JST89_00270 [Cyanobacteria bacterium SZAS-4]|nr:hypothetical protein [Cyanobacteria bacterium SZAS-4]